LGSESGFSFDTADLNRCIVDTRGWDYLLLLNVLYQSTIDVQRVLSLASRAAAPGALIAVSGPMGPESFAGAEPHIIAQLCRDGHYVGNEAEVERIREANQRLLSGQGNYWSVEGMAALLAKFGFTNVIHADMSCYYGFAYLVVAEKSA
jgi:hypothetical protein